MAKPAEAPTRGRPPTGAAKTSTERNAERRERLKQEGWRSVTALLDPAAAAALERLCAAGLTIDQAVGQALVAHAARRR